MELEPKKCKKKFRNRLESRKELRQKNSRDLRRNLNMRENNSFCSKIGCLKMKLCPNGKVSLKPWQRLNNRRSKRLLSKNLRNRHCSKTRLAQLNKLAKMPRRRSSLSLIIWSRENGKQSHSTRRGTNCLRFSSAKYKNWKRRIYPRDT